MSPEGAVNYRSLYDGYWQALDRVGECSGDVARIAAMVAETCGHGTALDVGCGEGFLVAELLSLGIDASGIDISAVVVERANSRWPDRFVEGSVLSLPFPDASFDLVLSTDCMEHLLPDDVPSALREMHRVTSRYVFLQIATTHDRDGHWHLTVENRAWWEARSLEAGFRKHALYYHANPYEALNHDAWQILVLLEKVSPDALSSFDPSALAEERLLHTDMLREVGRRSDAHCIRYHKAAELIRPGDRVLDVACGLGYGSHILYSASPARTVLGVDLSAFGISYAKAHYGRQGVVEFKVGDAQTLDFLPDHSVDFIAAFETIEHVPNPLAYLRALQRVLRPAGRVMVCAPNNWVDETGEDPNPHHLHVYTWERLTAECARFFLLEQGFLQTAGGAMKCHHGERKWMAVPVDRTPIADSEWILLLGMADPVSGQAVPYEETVWKLPSDPDFHVSAFARDYVNPWLVKGMVAIGMRSRSTRLLTEMQERVLASADPDSVDYGAALCGRLYARLASETCINEATGESDAEVMRYAAIANPSPHQFRWQVSLLFAAGELARRQGRFHDAKAFYTECAGLNVVAYSPLLGNKVVDALYWLAVFALDCHDRETAKAQLLRSIQTVNELVSGSWLNVIGDQKAPLPFGLAELAQLLDKASRAAYMLSSMDSVDLRRGLVFQESSGFFERQLTERDRRLTQLAGSISELQEVLAKQDARVQELAQEVVSQNAHAQALAREVSAQDAHAQALAREVSARDADAQRFARDLVQAHAEMDELRETIRKQDAVLLYLRPRLWLERLRRIGWKRNP